MQMAKNNFGIEFVGLDKYIKDLKTMEKQTTKVIAQEYTKYGSLVEKGAKALVHHDGGELEDHTNFDKARIEGSSVVVEGGSNLKYALRRHEEPYRPGVHDKYENGRFSPGYYVNGRGEGTRGKPPWRGYEPGRKFLENAIKATEKDYNKTNDRAIDRILGMKK